MFSRKFSIRYVAQEFLKILLFLLFFGVVESVFKLSGISVFIWIVSIFLLLGKFTSSASNRKRNKNIELDPVGFSWRFKFNCGEKLSKEAAIMRSRNESRINVVTIFLLFYGFSGGIDSFLNILMLITVLSIAHPGGHSYIDKNLNNYYKFRGTFNGAIRVSSRNGGDTYYVSVVDYENREEVVINVSGEKMLDFKGGDIVDVIYGGFSKSAIYIY